MDKGSSPELRILKSSHNNTYRAWVQFIMLCNFPLVISSLYYKPRQSLNFYPDTVFLFVTMLLLPDIFVSWEYSSHFRSFRFYFASLIQIFHYRDRFGLLNRTRYLASGPPLLTEQILIFIDKDGFITCLEKMSTTFVSSISCLCICTPH